MKALPSGVYHYRFMVDGEWKHAPDVPWMIDQETGNVYNILDLQAMWISPKLIFQINLIITIKSRVNKKKN